MPGSGLQQEQGQWPHAADDGEGEADAENQENASLRGMGRRV